MVRLRAFMTVEYIHNHVHTAWGLRVFAVVEAERFTAAICTLARAGLTNLGRAIHTAIDRGAVFGSEACGFVCIVIFTSGGRFDTIGGNAGSGVAGEAVATVLIELTEAAFLANAFVAAVTACETLRVGFTNNGRWLVSSLSIGALSIGALTIGALRVAAVLGAVICPTAIRLIRVCLLFKVEMAAGNSQGAKGEGGEEEEVAKHDASVRHHRGLLATNCAHRRGLMPAGTAC